MELEYKRRAVILVDGIVCSTVKWLTPDISWKDYAAWLRQRRPGLDVIHLEQPHDWAEIIAGQAMTYDEVLAMMLEKAIEEYDPRWREVAIFGYSLGGLTALNVALDFARSIPGVKFDYIAYVSMGTPFAGSGRLLDRMLERMPYDYFEKMLDSEYNRKLMSALLQFAKQGQLSVIIGDIENDEMVSPKSSRLALSWLEAAPKYDGFRWGEAHIKTLMPMRAHDGLLHDQHSLAYIDGMIDGLLPPLEEKPYMPYENMGILRWARRVLGME